MTTPALIIWATVLAVGLFAAWRNPTALALVISWAAGTYVGIRTDDNLPLWFYPYADITAIAIIAAKAERSAADRVVLLVFPACFVVYVADIETFYKWWALYYLVLAQFAAVAWDSLFTFRRASNAASDTPDTPSGDMFRRLAWGRGGG